MTELKNTRFLDALLKKPIDRTPIWLMRQAGRYLPEYRALRQKEPDFFTFCATPELACEATLQPLKRFALDAAIIFSDILTIPRAMGCDIVMSENQGPMAPYPIRSEKLIHALETQSVEKLQYVFDAIALSKKQLQGQVPLIGFSGSPWTVATYMVEGKSSRTFEIIKSLLFREPALLHQLLQKITDITIDYLNAQIHAGADAMMIFDTWGGALSPSDYQQFSLHYMNVIAKKIQREKNSKKIPLIFFSKGCGLYLDAIANSGCNAVGLDWTMDLLTAKKQIGDRVALQGNLDPAILLSTPEKIAAETKKILSVYQGKTGFVFNLGHGLLKETSPEHVQALVEVVSSF